MAELNSVAVNNLTKETVIDKAFSRGTTEMVSIRLPVEPVGTVNRFLLIRVVQMRRNDINGGNIGHQFEVQEGYVSLTRDGPEVPFTTKFISPRGVNPKHRIVFKNAVLLASGMAEQKDLTFETKWE